MNSLKKITSLSALSLISMMNAQSVRTILNMKESFRKDTIFSINADTKATYFPVTIIKGKQKGPVFSIVAGIHGYEYPPIIAIQELLNEVRPENLKGILIIVPIANEDLLPFVCYYDRKDTPEKTNAAKSLSRQSGMKYVVSYPYNLAQTEPAKYAFKQAAQQGITALSIEAGKLGTVQNENVQMIKTAVYRMLEYSNMYSSPFKNKVQAKTIQLDNQDYIRVPENGIFYSHLKSGDSVRKNQILGYITDEFGKKKQDIISETNGIILYKVGTPPVNKGETLFCIGYTKS